MVALTYWPETEIARLEAEIARLQSELRHADATLGQYVLEHQKFRKALRQIADHADWPYANIAHEALEDTKDVQSENDEIKIGKDQ